jgi:phage shock protein PspC (stress-responsive transcriptional regulator)
MTRDDTLLGICEGIGHDFGFNPLWLRLAFAVTLLFSPVAVIGTYLALGLVVALTHWLYPMVHRQCLAPKERPVEISASSQGDFAIAA